MHVNEGGEVRAGGWGGQQTERGGGRESRVWGGGSVCLLIRVFIFCYWVEIRGRRVDEDGHPLVTHTHSVSVCV